MGFTPAQEQLPGHHQFEQRGNSTRKVQAFGPNETSTSSWLDSYYFFADKRGWISAARPKLDRTKTIDRQQQSPQAGNTPKVQRYALILPANGAACQESNRTHSRCTQSP
jgi:hypothetical protein